VMTDNALIYTRAHAFKHALENAGARHIVTPKFTPRWNGRVERFIRRSTLNGSTAASDPTATATTARSDRSCAITTATDPTAHSATGPQSAVFTTSVSRTASAPARHGRRSAHHRPRPTAWAATAAPGLRLPERHS
jgi:hypothetical protein